MNVIIRAIGGLRWIERTDAISNRKCGDGAGKPSTRPGAQSPQTGDALAWRERMLRLAAEWIESLATVARYEPEGWARREYTQALVQEQRIARESRALQDELRMRCLPA